MKAIDLRQALDASKENTVQDLARIISSRSAEKSSTHCFFLGAGASASSGIRTGGELVKLWRKEIYLESQKTPPALFSDDAVTQKLKDLLPKSYDPEREYSVLFEHKYRLPKQRRNFIESEVTKKLPSIGYAYLVRLAEQHFTRCILTTNFDDLVNEAFYQFSSERPLVCAHDSSLSSISLTSTRPKIIKLHGDFLFDNIKSTIHETEKLEDKTKEKLTEFLREYGLVIAGYSGGDSSIMKHLDELTSKRDHIPYGLYWCFRKEDCVNKETLNILKKDSCFYVLTEGFDELLANLYSNLCGDQTPFNSKLASDRASSVIESYLKNKQLINSDCETIRRHLDELTKEKNTSLVLNAIHSLKEDIFIGGNNINDSELLTYLEIQRLINERKYTDAALNIERELSLNHSEHLKKILYHRLFACYRSLHKPTAAAQAAEAMLQLEPENLFILVSKSQVIDDPQLKISILKNAHEKAPYNTSILYRLCSELVELYENPESPELKPNEGELTALLKKCIELNPHISNRSYWTLFDLKLSANKPELDQDLQSIIDVHLKQNPYSALTLRLINSYCRSNKSRAYKGKDICDYANDAWKLHFPRDHGGLFDIISDIFVDHDEPNKLKALISECSSINEITKDEDFCIARVYLEYEFFRNLDSAITIAENFLSNIDSADLELMLVDYYTLKGQTQKARKSLEGIAGTLTETTFTFKKAKIFEAERRYQDALDCMGGIRNSKDRCKYLFYTTYLSLCLGDYKSAYDRSREFLTKHNFDNQFDVCIINYEFAKFKMRGKVSQPRLKELIKATSNQSAKAVAHKLLGEEKAALDIFKTEGAKRFSIVDGAEEWPALASIRDQIIAIKSDLIANRRSMNESTSSIIDV